MPPSRARGPSPHQHGGASGGSPGGGRRLGSGASSRQVEGARVCVPGQVWASELQEILRRNGPRFEPGAAVTEGA